MRVQITIRIMGMNGAPNKRDGFLGMTGHEKWEAGKPFATKEEVEEALASMIKHGIKTGVQGELGDPGKKEIKERVASALEGRNPETLTPSDVAHEIARQLDNAGSGKTRFEWPKSIPDTRGE